MIEPLHFLSALRGASVDFFAGVPDSLLKAFCACLIDKKSLFRGTGTRPPACACPHADRLEPV